MTRNTIALYKDTVSKEWKLITRELATLKHAKKMEERYKSMKLKTKIIVLNLE